MRRAAGRLRVQGIGVLALSVLAIGLCVSSSAIAKEKAPRFRVVVLAEQGGIHKPFVDAAPEWLNALARQNDFAVDYIAAISSLSYVELWVIYPYYLSCPCPERSPTVCVCVLE